MSLSKFISAKMSAIDRALDGFLPKASNKPATIHKAMRYSVFAGGSFSSTFLDTGSNGIFFDSYIPNCTYPNDSGFYCPFTDIALNVTLGGAGTVRARASFTLSNAAALFQKGNSALPTLGGSLSAQGLLDLGLPFFYGKTVVIGIDGLSTTGVGTGTATGPFYAL